MDYEALQTRLAKAQFPRSSRYDARTIVECVMGPHVLWLA